MTIDNVLLLKTLGLQQPYPHSNVDGKYHVRHKLKHEVLTVQELTDIQQTGHDCQVLAYEPTLEEFWSFIVTKLPLYMTIPTVMMTYNWEKKQYELLSASFDTVVSAPNQKDALMLFLTLCLFYGKENNG